MSAVAHDSEPKMAITPAEWEAWESQAHPPTIYQPPQKRAAFEMNCLYPCLRSYCCGVPACVRCCVLKPCCDQRIVSISQPDEWFAEMLSRTHPLCPDKYKGVFWMMDNVASEGVNTLQDGDWSSPRFMRKSAKYNWSVDAYNIWGSILSCNFWLRGGVHQFEAGPGGKWMHIKVLYHGSHWIYELQPGDKLSRPDGSPMDFLPGHDFLRVSYAEQIPNSEVSYLYLLRRVAYLDAHGKVVKTKAYDELLEAARHCCAQGQLPFITDVQAVTFAKMPEQQRMGDVVGALQPNSGGFTPLPTTDPIYTPISLPCCCRT
mmetsp:Transcript_51809/g.131595  ORF Transcript_51809/g.131595 Transcript_51809/m.131595 type:complete len:317 (+) Transcript_51809:90-1040(+)